MFRKIYDYIKDNEFRFTVYNDKIHVVNYKKIISLKHDSIFLEGEFLLKIYGSGLVLNKLLDQELLIVGNIKNIEVINND